MNHRPPYVLISILATFWSRKSDLLTCYTALLAVCGNASAHCRYSSDGWRTFIQAYLRTSQRRDLFNHDINAVTHRRQPSTKMQNHVISQQFNVAMSSSMFALHAGTFPAAFSFTRYRPGSLTFVHGPSRNTVVKVSRAPWRTI